MPLRPPSDPIPELKQQARDTLVALLDGGGAHEAAVLIRTDEPRVLDLRRGDLRRFSLETLIRFITRMRRRVELRITDATVPPKR